MSKHLPPAPAGRGVGTEEGVLVPAALEAGKGAVRKAGHIDAGRSEVEVRPDIALVRTELSHPTPGTGGRVEGGDVNGSRVESGSLRTSPTLSIRRP